MGRRRGARAGRGRGCREPGGTERGVGRGTPVSKGWGISGPPLAPGPRLRAGLAAPGAAPMSRLLPARRLRVRMGEAAAGSFLSPPVSARSPLRPPRPHVHPLPSPLSQFLRQKRPQAYPAFVRHCPQLSILKISNLWKRLKKHLAPFARLASPVVRIWQPAGRLWSTLSLSLSADPHRVLLNHLKAS